jgi:hypothetical protein
MKELQITSCLSYTSAPAGRLKFSYCTRQPLARLQHADRGDASGDSRQGSGWSASQLSTQVAVNYGSSLQIQRRSPASERLLLSVEFRYNELAEFDRTGRKVPMVDPSYA